jgi:universal stress protein A
MMIPASPDLEKRARPAPAPRPFPGSIRRILCPTDLTEAADVAFAHACLLAETFDAELTLFHSIDVRKVARGMSRGAPMEEALRRAERDAVTGLDNRAARTSAVTHVSVEYGLSPQQAVVAAIASRRPDLTVMSTHGRKGIAHLLKGSLAESAIEESRRPILCVRGREHTAAHTYRRILVPTDLRSRTAFSIAGLLARAFDAELIALHLVPGERASLAGLPQAVDVVVPSDEEVALFLEPECWGVHVTPRVEMASSWESIPALAAREGCDLIVMSTRRHDSVADSILGSRAERIVALAPCPVVVV